MRSAANLLAAFSVVVFLFALMSAKDSDHYLVAVVGIGGGISGTACFISEVYTVHKEQKQRTKSASQSQLQIQESSVAKEEVSECSWIFVWLCFAMTMSLPVMSVIYR